MTLMEPSCPGRGIILILLILNGLMSVDTESQESLRTLIETHVEHSGSGLAKAMLADWANSAKGFVRLTPKPQH